MFRQISSCEKNYILPKLRLVYAFKLIFQNCLLIYKKKKKSFFS